MNTKSQERINTLSLDKPFRNLWRVYIETPDAVDGEEITLFVNGHSKDEAINAVLKVVSAIYPSMDENDTNNSIYTLNHAIDLLESGVSEELVYRLFESSIRGSNGRFVVNAWCKAPVFAVKHPSALYRAWSDAIAHFKKPDEKRLDLSLTPEEIGQRLINFKKDIAANPDDRSTKNKNPSPK